VRGEVLAVFPKGERKIAGEDHQRGDIYLGEQGPHVGSARRGRERRRDARAGREAFGTAAESGVGRAASERGHLFGEYARSPLVQHHGDDHGERIVDEFGRKGAGKRVQQHQSFDPVAPRSGEQYGCMASKALSHDDDTLRANGVQHRDRGACPVVEITAALERHGVGSADAETIESNDATAPA
jgi:hypothetical protein